MRVCVCMCMRVCVCACVRVCVYVHVCVCVYPHHISMLPEYSVEPSRTSGGRYLGTTRRGSYVRTIVSTVLSVVGMGNNENTKGLTAKSFPLDYFHSPTHNIT